MSGLMSPEGQGRAHWRAGQLKFAPLAAETRGKKRFQERVAIPEFPAKGQRQHLDLLSAASLASSKLCSCLISV